jgi:hypothetical protein
MAPTQGGGRPDKYLTAAGETVPSVTTILDRFKDSGALLHWAWKQGIDRVDYKATRDSAGAHGSAVHESAEKLLHGASAEECEDFIITKLPDVAAAVDAIQAFRSFSRWVAKVRPPVTDTELPLVSERYKFAGCIDVIAADAWQIDLKSGKRVYLDHLLQIAAYDILHEEVRGERFRRFTLLHIPKDGSECVSYNWNHLDAARAMFLSLRASYELESQVQMQMKEAEKC